MLNIVKVLLSLAGEHKLKFSMTQIEHITAQLVAMLIIGMFLTTLTAIAASVGFFALYQGLMLMGLSATMSALVVGLTLALVLAVCVARLSYYMKSIRAGLHSVAKFETPVVGPVVGHVNNVAQSFLSGLMQSSKPKADRNAEIAPSNETTRSRPTLVRTRSL